MDKKELIINSARDLFYNYGYKKVSMDEIAKVSNVTKRTIYKYFKDKDSLFKYFIDEEMNNIKKIFIKIENKNLNFVETVHTSLYELFEYGKKSKFFRTLQEEVYLIEITPVKKHLENIENEIKNYIQTKLEIAVNKNEIKKCNIKLCAFLIYKLYKALLVEWDYDTYPLSEKEVTDNIMLILRTGMLS